MPHIQRTTVPDAGKSSSRPYDRPVFALQHVSWGVRVDGAAVLDDVSLDLDRPGLTVIAGANGSGKSSLLRVAAGLARPDNGDVQRAAGTRVGVVMQDPESQLIAATVVEEVAACGELEGRPRAQLHETVLEALARFDLGQLAERSPTEISGGQLQRVVIAAVAAWSPDVLLLDEPSSQLDPAHRAEIRRRLRALADQGVPVVLATQHGEDLAIADRLVVMVDGRITWDGPPQPVVNDPQRMAAWCLPRPFSSSFRDLLRTAGVIVDESARTGHELATQLAQRVRNPR